METLAEALKQIAAKCPCRAHVRVADGRAGQPVLVCTDPPTCTQGLGWKEFRDRLGSQSR